MLAFFAPVRDLLHNHRPVGWTRIGMRRKAFFTVNSGLLTSKATQRIARDRVQTKVCAMYCASSP